ncbi:hypothetical protein [Rhodopirellula halodulae]|uniref:hypothetical protein n=1 Tax=Rhodopirellula halodulae TaxID=2894198 RepID=UPI001E2A2CC9|nr:hypothetical protein [Rhodopirellula sp. JC737]MCC9658788.1 hypothetical protein [Rhodopirellula sp. JC737]
MTTAFGTFLWNGTLPSDDLVGTNPETKVSDDFGEQWAHEANRMIAIAVHPQFVANEAFASVGAPTADEHCWSITFRFNDRDASIWLQWVPDGDHENAFAFDIGYSYNLLRSLFERTGNVRDLDTLRLAVSRSLAAHPLIFDLVWDRRPD